MVEIYKVIAFIPLLDQIFDDKNKNGSVKGPIITKYTCAGILDLLAFVSVFLMIRKMYIFDILYAAILFLMITIRVNMQ